MAIIVRAYAWRLDAHGGFADDHLKGGFEGGTTRFALITMQQAGNVKMPLSLR